MENDPNGNDGNGASGDPSSDSYEVPGWHAGLPDAYKGHPALKGMDVPGKLVEAYLDAKERASKYEGKAYFPGEGASSEEWAAFRKAIGVPESKDGYVFNLPEDMDRNEVESLAEWMKDVAFQEGLPANATQRIFDRWIGDTKKAREEAHKRQVQMKQEKENALKEKYGEKWESRVNSAREFVKSKLGEDVYKSMTEQNLLDDPVYLDSFGSLSESLSEDFLPGNGSGVSGGGSNRNALDELFPSMK